MTRHHHGDAVMRARAAHRARGAWGAQLPRQTGIAHRLALRHFHQRVPHALLEAGPQQVDRHVRLATGEALGDGLQARSKEIVTAGFHALELRMREFIAQSPFQCGVVLAQFDRADAALSGGHQRAAEHGVDECPADRHAAATGTVGGRCHAEFRRSLLVQPRRRTVAGIVERGGDVAPFAQGRLQRAQLLAGEVLGRTQAEARAKPALQMRGAETGVRSQVRQ